jgi:hypothetical protein
VLTLIATLIYGGDVAALGSPDWHARESAERRLVAAGWRCLPALVGRCLPALVGRCPESGARCERVRERLPCQGPWLVRKLLAADQVPELPDAVWIALRPYVGRVAEQCTPIPVRALDGRCATLTTAVTDWMQREPYYAGTEAGDVRLVVEGLRRR